MAVLSSECQLYLDLSALEAGEAMRLAALALDAGEIDCALIRKNPAAADGPLTAELVKLIQRHGAAALIEDDFALAAALGADGVHLSSPDPGGEAVAEARRALGGEASIGAEAGSSRHLAMVCAERGADYISFGSNAAGHHQIGQIAAMVRWWSEIFEPPCVAWLWGGTDGAGALIDAGADFLAAGDAVWMNESGPAAAVSQLRRAVERASEK